MGEAFEENLDTLTVDEAAYFLGVTRNTLLTYVSKKKLIPNKKIELGKLLFDKETVQNFKIQKKHVQVKRSNLASLSKSHSAEEIEIIQEWRLHNRDTASVDVEIGLLTRRISRIEEELRLLQNDEVDFSMMRIHLLKAVNERRKKLDFLKNTDTSRYIRAIEKMEMMD